MSDFVRPARDEEVVAWFRNKPAPFPNIPPRSTSYNYGRSWSYHLSDEERETVRARQEMKKQVREAIDVCVGFKGPHGVDIRETWFKNLRVQRWKLQRIALEVAQGTLGEYEAKKQREEALKVAHRQINIIKDARLGEAPRWTAGISPLPFAADPNCKQIPYDELEVAEEHLTLHRLVMDMTYRDFMRLRARFRKGMLTGYWSDKFDINDVYSHYENAKVPCLFVFSEESDLERVTEELVWIKMRY